MPDRRSVTFNRLTAATPTYTSYTVGDAWYRPDEVQEGDPSQGVYLRRFRRWYLVKERLTAAGFSTNPDPGDTITSTATTIDPLAGTWTVLSQSEVGALGAYELRCVKVELRSGLAVTVIQQRRTGAKDATGRVLPIVSAVATVTGWFQSEDTQTVPDLLGKTQAPQRGTVYLATQLDVVKATDTFLVNGVGYNVDEVNRPDRLDSLMYVRVSLAS